MPAVRGATPIEARAAVAFRPDIKAVPRALEKGVARPDSLKAAALPERIQKDIARVKKLEEAGTQPDEILRELGKRREFPLQQTELEGLGKKLAPEGGDAVQKLQQFSEYADIQRAVSRGKPLTDVLKVYGKSEQEYADLRKSALGSIAETEVIHELVPDLAEITDETVKLDVVEAYLGSDPELNAAVIRNTREVIAKAAAIPEKPEGPKTGETPDTAKTKLAAKLSESLKPPLKNTTEDLGKIMDGKTVEEATSSMFDALLKANGVKDIYSLKTYVLTESIRTRLQALQAQKSPNAETNTQITDLADKLSVAEAQFKATGGVKPSSQDLALYRQIDQKINGSTNPNNITGPKIGGVTAEIGSYVKAKNEAAKPTVVTPEEQKSLDARAIEQQKVTFDLKQVMNKSVYEVIAKRNQILTERQAIETEGNARALEEQGKKDIAEGVRMIGRDKGERWAKYDPQKRKIEYDRKTIGEDMHRLAAEGQDGVRRLMLRKLASGDNAPVKLVDAEGKPLKVQVKDAYGNVTEVNATWDNVDLDQLTPENRSTLDEVYKQESKAFTQKLFVDYYSARGARGIKDALNVGYTGREMKLTKDEFKRLYDVFGADLQAGVDKAGSMKNINQTLKERGIQPSSELGLLLLLPVLLGSLGRKKEEMFGGETTAQAA